MAAADAKIEVRSFERRKQARRPLPEHSPRERIVYPAPAACPCCGGALHKIGEDITETLELIPRQWKVIQHVREHEAWLREQRRRLSSKSDTAQAIDYSLKRWPALTRFLDDGRCACPTMPLSEDCAASRSVATTGPSPARTKAVVAPPRANYSSMRSGPHACLMLGLTLTARQVGDDVVDGTCGTTALHLTLGRQISSMNSQPLATSV
jgi:hypothetical protein